MHQKVTKIPKASQVISFLLSLSINCSQQITVHPENGRSAINDGAKQRTAVQLPRLPIAVVEPKPSQILYRHSTSSSVVGQSIPRTTQLIGKKWALQTRHHHTDKLLQIALPAFLLRCDKSAERSVLAGEHLRRFLRRTAAHRQSPATQPNQPVNLRGGWERPRTASTLSNTHHKHRDDDGDHPVDHRQKATRLGGQEQHNSLPQYRHSRSDRQIDFWFEFSIWISIWFLIESQFKFRFKFLFER